MKEGLLFYRVNSDCTGFSIHQAEEHAIFVDASPAAPYLIIVKLAFSRAKFTLHSFAHISIIKLLFLFPPVHTLLLAQSLF